MAVQSMEVYKSRLLQKSDIPSLRDLYWNAFRLKFPYGYAERKFFHEYQVLRNSFATFSSSGGMVSFYGIICQRASFNRKEFYICQSCDSMTHSSHSGKGLFVKLAKEAYENCRKEGVKFLYGFPNETIYNLRIKRLNWVHSDDINVYQINVRTLPLSKLVKKFPGLNGFYNFYLRRMIKSEISGNNWFSNSVIREGVGGIVHDDNYFSYKASPNKFILELSGANYWVKFDGMMWVGDFENSGLEDFRQSLSQLKHLAKLTGCTRILFHFQNGSPNDLLLSKIYSPSSKMPLGKFILEEEARDWNIEFTGADFDTW